MLQLQQKQQSLVLTEVVFDRGGYLYHGRVKAVADGAREGGLNFRNSNIKYINRSNLNR